MNMNGMNGMNSINGMNGTNGPKSKSVSQGGSSYNNSRRNSGNSSPNVGGGQSQLITIDKYMHNVDENKNSDIEISESKRRKLESVMSGDMGGMTQIGFGSKFNANRLSVSQAGQNDIMNQVNHNSQQSKRMSVDNDMNQMNQMNQMNRRRIADNNNNSRDISIVGKKRKNEDVSLQSGNKGNPSKRSKKTKRANSETPKGKKSNLMQETPFTLAAQAAQSSQSQRNLNSSNSNNNNNNNNGFGSLSFGSTFNSISSCSFGSINGARNAMNSVNELSNLSLSDTHGSENSNLFMIRGQLEQEYKNKLRELESQNAQNLSKISNFENLISSLQLSNRDLTNQLNKHKELLSQCENECKRSENRNDRARDSLIKLLKEKGKYERVEREKKLIEDNKLIGNVVQESDPRCGFATHDLWQDGQLFDNLKQKIKFLTDEKKEIDEKKKELKKRRKSQKLNANTNTNSNGNSNAMDRDDENSVTTSHSNENDNSNRMEDDDGFVSPMPVNIVHKMLDTISVDTEILSLRRLQINKQLSELGVEQRDLEHRKKLHIKFIRLMRDESRSRFNIFNSNNGNNGNNGNNNNNNILNGRYLLINLLGKGGFSEVHRAYDLQEYRYVACKIHQLNSHWSDERKKNYTKHATREYDIHKSLEHGRIVQLYDVFGIDVNSFCTVLEYCDGMDLDIYLKMHQILSEKEARSIMVQVFQGLEYLSSQESPIIHYDLKPGNLLYKNGNIKLTDFGLAKIMETNCDQMELTSQGAGTYWYLPPECFVMSNNGPAMISPKVDIWSAGVIFFQMLFGKKPFGDQQSQDKILSENTILKAKTVKFPQKDKQSIKVSQEAKQFITQCLSYEPKDRMSATDILNKHPYFAYLRK